MSDDYDLSSPVGRGNWRADRLYEAYERTRNDHGLSSDEMYQATHRYPFAYRDIDDLSTPYNRADYRVILHHDVRGSVNRYLHDRGGHNNVYENPDYTIGYTGYRRRH